jgi:hypothetical protein
LGWGGRTAQAINLDDKRAMHELHRVLKPSGWAVIVVPITAEKTTEDQSESDPLERLRRFGQEDHVRRYGPDYAGRLREQGFLVDCISVNDLMNEKERVLMGLTEAAGEIYYCRKHVSA